jgi:hypothetical protein
MPETGATGATDAVNVTGWPNTDGIGLAVKNVVVRVGPAGTTTTVSGLELEET